ncbi:NAD(P)-binding protein [Nocardioides sp. zg-1308]|uniref:NAD(P)/FAD-dependent oxidoreductase n=1 Tax=Nocardioides sp. zg-1308 TaxID=2736253 RepID=UPI001555BDAC|nr:NAD(P)-binding protein [Nocardioides sp. zg-1308]NPD05385.1 NAD(P)-binding protein [Nocardioides sp. zg-1308]
MSADVVVVGAGLAGVACACELRRAGVGVSAVDRGHRPGGRMASRRLWDRPVDLGASYFTVSDGGFEDAVDDWSRRGLATPWTETFCVLEDGEVRLSSGPARWGAPRGLRSLVEDLAAGLEVQSRPVEDVADLDAAAVVLAMPDPQARRLVRDHPLAASLDRDWEPVIAVAARWPERTWDDVSPSGRFDGAFVNGDPALGWVADDGRRRGDDAPVLVLHSTSDLAGRHLEDPASAVPAMVGSVRRLLGLPEPADTYAHRWTFARPVGEREDPYALVGRPAGLVGVCGDGWGPKPRVEAAWLSGVALARELVDRL